MQSKKFKLNLLTAIALAAALVGCGGGSDVGSSATNNRDSSALTSAVSAVTSHTLDVPLLSSAEATAMAKPFFVSRPVAAPTPVDSVSSLLSAKQAAPTETPVVPHEASVSASVYTPAQIRAAYQLPPLPTSWTGLTAAQAAQFGAGQTIYIVDAYHNPNTAAELAAFNTRFGLPSCTTVAIPASTTLPLAAANPSTGCQFSVVYANSDGVMTATAPSYNSGWAQEIALDVQWAHATAPLARIILIEASYSDLGTMLGAINLANAMGPGVVSMSFGAGEGNWTSSMDSAFSGADMSYVASTGDDGAGVAWPSVSARVLAIGGTSLRSYTSTARDEATWSPTGGGVSQYVKVPEYQTASVQGMGSQTRRNVADVAFNADPATGQYTAIIPPGSTSPTWYSMGGTSLSAPQWAGVIAVTNAVRAQNKQGPLGLVQNFIYKAATTTANFFTTIMNDIASGDNGGYFAKSGYDQPTGLGTPHVSKLITLADGSGSAGSTTVGSPPSVSAVTINGVSGTALSFSMPHSSSNNSLRWDLTNAPNGMTINASGLVLWSAPVAGTYTVTANATDSVTGLTGSAIASITVAQPVVAPIVSNATVAGQAGKVFSYTIPPQSTAPQSFSLVGVVPAGMTISPSGTLSWTNPLAGTYPITVKATDTTTLATGTGVITVQIAKATVTATGPVISASALTGTAGKFLTGTIGISASGERSIRINIRGNPSGMRFSVSGQSILMRWARPVRGSYTLVITATDSKGLSAQATMPITIN